VPEHLFTIVARGHSVDVQTNNLTIYSVLEEIGAAELPFAIPQFGIVTLWRRQEGEEGVSFMQRTRLLDPDGAEVFNFETEFALHKRRHRSLGTVNMVPIEKAGQYLFEVQIRQVDEAETDYRTAGHFPLEVQVLQKQEDSLLAESGK